jgi:hypothetical protein
MELYSSLILLLFVIVNTLQIVIIIIIRTALGPTQPPIQWVPGALSLGVKRPGSEAEHSPPSSGEIKEHVELYFHSSNTSSRRGA